jgi:hypothetical protein
MQRVRTCATKTYFEIELNVLLDLLVLGGKERTFSVGLNKDHLHQMLVISYSGIVNQIKSVAIWQQTVIFWHFDCERA